MNIKSLLSFLLLQLTLVYGVYAQVIQPGDRTREYYELMSLQNPEMTKPITIYPSIITQYYADSALSWNLWDAQYPMPSKPGKKSFQIVDPWLSYNINTKTPHGYNDGAMWSGKGSNFLITGGVRGNIGILHYAFVPLFTWSENKDFYIPDNVTNGNVSPYTYPFSRKIDFAQRFGNSSYSQFQWGQSELRLVYKKFTVGLSTENFQWGPSIWSPILMSMNAAGIPHLDIGTAAPIKTKLGDIEGKWFWGATDESDYFDSIEENNRKYVTGFAIGYSPSFMPGMSLGLNRIMYTRWADGDLSTRDFFAAFLHNEANDQRMKNDEYDQMMSAMIRYRFPEVGFEMYLEYAKNDFPGNFNDWMKQIDRSRALVWGVCKVFELKENKFLKVNYEFTTLSANQTQIPPQNASPPYYIHGVVQNGYTHQGQIMGAGIGPGSNASRLTVDMYTANGKYGFLFSRVRFNDDYFMNAYSKLPEPYPNDYEITLGIDYLRHLKNFSIHPQFMWNYRKNWYYQDDLMTSNFRFSIQIQYHLNTKI